MLGATPFLQVLQALRSPLALKDTVLYYEPLIELYQDFPKSEALFMPKLKKIIVSSNSLITYR